MNRTDIINLIIQKNNFSSYLEIGVNCPEVNFDRIECRFKRGVDPIPQRGDIIGTTSDFFFSQLLVNFDLIFIDGLHHCHQVLRDIENSLQHISENGIVLCHDMLPENEIIQQVPRVSSIWTGDCWKAWSFLRMTRKDLNMFVLNTDFGIGFIQKGKQNLYRPTIPLDEMNYSFFNSNKKKLMNVIELEEFLHPSL
jgi:hypothetical protein